jgi:hypothetical protein
MTLGQGNELDTPQFTHLYYEKAQSGVMSGAYKESEHIISALVQANHLPNEYEIIRIKANFTHNTTGYEIHHHQPIHYDSSDPSRYSILYYVHDSDGDTLFFSSEDKSKIVKRVSPKKGRAIIFDSNMFHAGCNPIVSPYRIVINTILLIDKFIES